MNDDTYFSEREYGFSPQDEQDVTQRFWGGFVTLINNNINEDHPHIWGTDELLQKLPYGVFAPEVTSS